MMKIKIMLAVFVGIMELSAVQADNTEKSNTENVSQDEVPCLAPYGIKLGQTTIEEVKMRFSVLRTEEMKGRHYFFKCYYLNPADFWISVYLMAIEVVVITIGNSNIVENIAIQYRGNSFGELKQELATKYEVVKSEGHYCALKPKGQLVGADLELRCNPSGNTVLEYSTKKFHEVVFKAFSEEMGKKYQREIKKKL